MRNYPFDKVYVSSFKFVNRPRTVTITTKSDRRQFEPEFEIVVRTSLV